MSDRESGSSMPVLITCKQLKDTFIIFNKISITSEEFTIGRGRENSSVIPYLAISRSHCKFKRLKSDEWILEDYSTFGIEINGVKVGKGSQKKVCDGDTIKMEPSEEFVYKFILHSDEEYEVPRKRIKIESNTSIPDIINNVKVKFEQSQSYERSHIKQKMVTTKQIISTSMKLKHQLQSEMDKKIQQLENDCAVQIENLKGEKNEVEQQTALLVKEKNAQLDLIQNEMGSKIAELMEEIKIHNKNEMQLSKENNLLKEKLEKEREAFLAELLRESSSKQDMLAELEKKIQDQENIRKKEKEELETIHKKENEQLRSAMEKELRDLEEQKKKCETELKKQLDTIKNNLAKQVEQTAEQRLKAEQELNNKLQAMKQHDEIERGKIEELKREREYLLKTFNEAQSSAEKSLQQLREQVKNRETELAVLAAERIQKQADQSSEVIQNLQDQLEKAKNQLKIVEKEKNTLLNEICIVEQVESTDLKQSTLNEVGCIMENELQCSICAELFIEATTLGCSHTFCAYCIGMWKKKKKNCPVCRTPIETECKSLVLDTFIEKMVENLSEEMKVKRQEMLEYRKELAERGGENNRSESSDDNSDSDYDFFEEEEEEEGGSLGSLFNSERGSTSSHSSSRLDNFSDTDINNPTESSYNSRSYGPRRDSTSDFDNFNDDSTPDFGFFSYDFF